MANRKLNLENVQPNILYYSKQCTHSKRFRHLLMKKPDLETTFIQLCVDNLPPNKLPPFVKSVPFIVVYNDQGQQLKLTDGAAFQWLNQKVEELAGNFEAYDSGVMSSSLSDTYAYISETGVCQAPTSHQFEWINTQEKPFLGSFSDTSTIPTPNEETFGGGRDKAPKSDLEKIIEMRNRDLPNHQKPAEIDFSKPFHLQQQQQQPNAAQYTQQARKQDVRMAAPQRGVDFQNPNFRTQPMPSQQRPQPINRPLNIHGAGAPMKRPQIQGRALPPTNRRI
jgi:hypothetical protein